MKSLRLWMWFLNCHTLIFASECYPPTVLPITNVALSNQQSARGIFASVGNPPQNISFMANSYLNDTWVYNNSAPFCTNGTTSNQCLSQRGGWYNPALSNSSITNLDVSEAGGDASDVARALGTHIWYSSWATDDFTVANITLHDYPIGQPGFDFGGRFDTQANIGLGQNSSILSKLKEAGLIQSRAYSYWFGINSATSSASVDGHIVLGGFDEAKVIGKGYTQPLLPPSSTCPSGMGVTVNQLTLNFPNGSNTNLLGSNSIAACFQIDFPVVLSVPDSPIYERYQIFTGTSPWGNSAGLYWYTPTYPTSDVYSGDLTITLQGGFSTRIPNDVLIVPDQMFDPSGAITYNHTSSVVLIDPLQAVNANDEPLIGKEFFSTTYLTVDFDAMTFTLWPVNITTESNLVAIGGNCSNSVNNTSSPTAPAPEASQSATIHDKSSNAGVIAGAVVGGLVALTGLIVAILFMVRKRRGNAREQREVAISAPIPEHEMYDSNNLQSPYHQVHYEMLDGRPKPQELAVERHVQELQGSFPRDEDGFRGYSNNS